MKLTPPPKYYKLGSPQATLLLDVQLDWYYLVDTKNIIDS